MKNQRESQTIAVPTRYRVIGRLGSGGMSHVYEAHDTVLDVTVAIKILQMEGQGQEQVLRFQREAKATAALRHDNIVKILDFGLTDDAVPYMVLDRIDGKSLKEVIDNDGPLTVERTIAVFMQVCSGLAHAHKNGIIHRDLKPSNIVFATGKHGEEIVKVIDFGIARIEDNASLTKTNAVIGSPPYMSPEQAAGGDINTTSDIYALGCVLFETLTGKTPFLGQTAVETIMMHMNDTPPRLSDIAEKEFPEPIENLVSALLEKEPADRPQSMERVLSTLREINPVTAVGIKEEAPSAKVEFAKGLLLVLAAIGGIIIIVVGTVLSIEFYMNESEKRNSLGTKEKFKERLKPFKKLYDPTVLLDRNDAFLKKEYENDTTTQTMMLAHCPVSDKGIEYIKHLPISVLDARFCKKITDKSFATFAQMKSLRIMHLDNITHIEGQGLQHLSELPDLRLLTVDGFSLSQEDFHSISKIRTLQNLCINRVENVNRAKLMELKSLPALLSIDMGGIHQSGETLEALSELKNVISVGLNNSETTDDDLRYLVKAKQIEKLVLARNPITDSGLLFLAKNLPNLRQLEIHRCPKLTDKGRAAFRKLKPKVNGEVEVDYRQPARAN